MAHTAALDERLSDFDFELPAERIAAVAAEPRDSSRLFALRAGGCEHRTFRDLPEFLRAGDVLVLNRTKVVPARLLGKKPTGGKADLLLVEGTGRRWRVLAKGARPGDRVELDGGAKATLLGRDVDGAVLCEFDVDDIRAYAETHGSAPLPPYILKRRKDAGEDRCRYQTVYAEVEGSIAAPTAGLHFTPGVLGALEAKGVRIAKLTMHIGWATFKPVETEDLSQHKMPAERFTIPDSVVEAVQSARRAGHRVVSVGTSATRSLETAAASGWTKLSGESDLFIRPGHRFQAIDLLLTNFHVPQSSPLLLASAFAGRERLLAAYREAISLGYRFYSYGDSMLIEPAR